MLELVWLIILFPAIGALINGLFGSTRIKDRAHIVGVGSVSISFAISCLILLAIATGTPATTITLYEWIVAGNFHVNISFLIDPLAAIMLMVVTGVGLLVHIYSIGYMHGDAGYPRFFAYLNLFMVSMLLLVMADNYLLMFVGWEGVGLCSYLLIGFWFQKKSAADAGKKAFIVNRIGDAGFLLGIFAIFITYGSVRYLDIFPHANMGSETVITLVTLLLFVGAMGKSAQLPLYVWLPDAMEGPTPVSALIHAATMVTAGVYMVVRSNPLYSLAPFSMEVVAVVGAITAIFAASIGLVQTDIKKVLAYSTVSQLGYMFLACGVGAYSSAIFHLFTHAFFKGLLFLGSGSVIHALSGEQDIRKMGGLSKKIPTTYRTFLIGTVAIAGIPPLAGFWSKDEILASAFSGGHYLLWAVGLITALMTSFYMFRLLFLTFYGSSRVDHEVEHHIHESPSNMTIPLMILAGFSLLIGLIVGFPPESGWIHKFLSPVIIGLEGAGAAGHHLSHGLEAILIALSVVAALSGLLLAFFFYIKMPEIPKKLANKFQGLYLALYNKYWVDEIYWTIIVQPMLKFSNFLWAFDQWVIDGLGNVMRWITILGSKIFHLFDVYVVDGTVNVLRWITILESREADNFDIYAVDGIGNEISTGLDLSARGLRRLHTGRIQNYMLAMVLGIAIYVVVILIFIL